MIRTGLLPSVTSARRGETRWIELAIAHDESLTYVIEGVLAGTSFSGPLVAGEFERTGVLGRDRRRVCAGERRGVLRLVAAHDPRAGQCAALRLAHDAT